MEQANHQNEADAVKVKKVRKRVERDGSHEKTDLLSERKAKKVKKKAAATTANKTVLNGTDSLAEQREAITEDLEARKIQNAVSAWYNSTSESSAFLSLC